MGWAIDRDPGPVLYVLPGRTHRQGKFPRPHRAHDRLQSKTALVQDRGPGRYRPDAHQPQAHADIFRLGHLRLAPGQQAHQAPDLRRDRQIPGQHRQARIGSHQPGGKALQDLQHGPARSGRSPRPRSRPATSGWP